MQNQEVKAKICLIEDEVRIAESIQVILELQHYKVSVYEDGIKGVQGILRNSPDLIICDINLPGINGFELLDILNSLMGPELVPPFIYLTAKTSHDDQRTGFNLGAEDYIMKPFKMKDLLLAIEGKLEKRTRIISTAIAQEQERISKDLHDGIQGMLVGALLGFRSLAQLTDLWSEFEKKQYQEFLLLLEDSVRKLRYTAHGLDFQAKSIQTIRQLLKELLQWYKNLPINFELNLASDFTLPENQAPALSQAIRECITNSIKHGECKNISIKTTQEEKTCTIALSDDGKGFDLKHSPMGYGLTSIEKVMNSNGGAFELKSTPGAGTTYILKIPR